jgi:sugar/nucleoside kinase (ribokinase family)
VDGPVDVRFSGPYPHATRPLVLAVGLVTVDVVHRVDRLAGSDEKVVGHDQRIEPGGPAANAARVAAMLHDGLQNEPHSEPHGTPLGDAYDRPHESARLLAPFGRSPLRPVLARSLRDAGVSWHDPRSHVPHEAPVSSILVEPSGARAVVSGGAPSLPATARLGRHTVERLLADVGAVLVDGHALPYALAVARAARERGIPVVFDGGSAKPGTRELLAHVDLAILSAAFRAPGGGDPLDWVQAAGVALVARSDGPRPVHARIGARRIRIPVPHVPVVDTTGAGDVLHGAAAQAVALLGLTPATVPDILRYAVQIASQSCAHAGVTLRGNPLKINLDQFLRW